MRWLGAASMVVVLAGCSVTVGGRATPATGALRVLPTDVEISSAAGNTLSTFGFQPFDGGAEILPNGFRTDVDASPIACAAVTDTAPRIVYQPLPVAEAARQSYFNWDPGVDTSGADAAVVRLSSAASARDAFASFERQWQQCAGRTVIKHVGAAVITADVTGVTAQESVVSATVRTHQGTSGPRSRYERALGVHGSTVVEVSLAITPAGERQPDPRGRATRVAQLMLDKVGAG